MVRISWILWTNRIMHIAMPILFSFYSAPDQVCNNHRRKIVVIHFVQLLAITIRKLLNFIISNRFHLQFRIFQFSSYGLADRFGFRLNSNFMQHSALHQFINRLHFFSMQNIYQNKHKNTFVQQNFANNKLNAFVWNTKKTTHTLLYRLSFWIKKKFKIKTKAFEIF